MLCPYIMKAFLEQLNELKVDYDRVTTMHKISGTTSDINVKDHHTRLCLVSVLY